MTSGFVEHAKLVQPLVAVLIEQDALQSDGVGIPYGVAMTLAALVVFTQTRWMTNFF